MVLRRLGWTIAACALVAGGVKADTVMTFDDLTPPISFLSSYSKDGFTLSTVESGYGFQSFGPSDTNYYPGSTALAIGSGGTSAQITRADALLFDLKSISLSKYFAFNDNPTVTFVGTKEDDTTVSQSFTTSTAMGVISFQDFTFSSDFTGLKKVTWLQESPFHQFDNMRLSLVPEAPTLVSAGLGLLGVAIGGWRRRASRGA